MLPSDWQLSAKLPVPSQFAFLVEINSSQLLVGLVNMHKRISHRTFFSIRELQVKKEGSERMVNAENAGKRVSLAALSSSLFAGGGPALRLGDFPGFHSFQK